MVILDSNIWIAFLNKGDGQHEKAERVFEKIDKKLILPEYLVVEICSVLALRVDKKAADKFIDFVLDNNDIEILLSNEDFFTGSWKVFKETKTAKLSFIDCSLLHLSNFYEVITFDKSLQKAMSGKK
jgi:predicted nucleic acid-binding protein